MDTTKNRHKTNASEKADTEEQKTVSAYNFRHSRRACAYRLWHILLRYEIHGGFGTDHGGASIEERMIFAVMNKKWN